jgi:hypothetical protein
MAGSRTFTSPSGSPPKMKSGKANRPKRSAEVAANPFNEKARDPLRFASAKIPAFSDRHSHTNGKFGFHTSPPRPPAGRLAHRPGKPNRGSGKEHRAQL